MPTDIPTPDYAQIVVTGLNKSSVQTGVRVDDIEIYGSGFQQEAKVLLRKEGRPDILAYEREVVNSGLIKCKFNLISLEISFNEEGWVLLVENPDGQVDGRQFWIKKPDGDGDGNNGPDDK